MGWLENLNISFECKDMLSMEVDALVCPVNVELEEYGKISKMIFSLGGSHLREDILAVKESLNNGILALGEAVSLECRSIYHIGNFKRLIFVVLWAFHSEYTENLFYKSYINSLRQGFQFNVKSIALPVMAYDGNLKTSGEAIVKVIHDLDALKKSSEFSIEEVFFVTNKMGHIDFLKNEVEPRLY